MIAGGIDDETLDAYATRRRLGGPPALWEVCIVSALKQDVLAVFTEAALFNEVRKLGFDEALRDELAAGAKVFRSQSMQLEALERSKEIAWISGVPPCPQYRFYLLLENMRYVFQPLQTSYGSARVFNGRLVIGEGAERGVATTLDFGVRVKGA